MKKLITLIALIFSAFANAQISQNINLLGTWDDPSIPPESIHGLRYSSIWGYTQASREYAIVGAGNGNYFIDVTNPASPVQIDFVAGRRDSCVYHENKTYQHYAYCISDDGVNSHNQNSFQIVDLQYLPDSVHVVYDDTALFVRSHSLYVDGDKLYCGSVTTNKTFHSMAVFSLANPESPVFLRALEQDYPAINHVHDMFVRNDTVYASCGYNDGLHIYKFNGSNFVEIGSVPSYPQQGYNHSGWLTDDGKTYVFADEVPANLDVKVIDVSDMSNIALTDLFNCGTTATPHNIYVLGNDKAVIAYYKDGLQIFDITDPANVAKTGYYDTDPTDGTAYSYYVNPTYQGAWGAYPFLPSGIVLVNDMQNGLFIFDASQALGVKENNQESITATIYPNPSTGKFQIQSSKFQVGRIDIYNMLGEKIYHDVISSGARNLQIDLSNQPDGIYFLTIKTGEATLSKKLIKSK